MKALILTFVATFAVIMLSNSLFTGARVDLTDNQLYTLSEGTKAILSDLDKPVELEFYFSDKATTQLPILRTYAQRVEEVLEEYVSLSQGKLSLEKIDPEPFSEDEDAADLAGLQGIPAGLRGDNVYFGLVARTAEPSEAEEGEEDSVDELIIPFFQPEKETFLEYDLTRLIASLGSKSIPTIGVISGVEISGGFDFMTRANRPAWAVLQVLEDNFELLWIDDDATEIKGVDALLVVAPQNLDPRLQLAIDQYVLAGGRSMVFVDPQTEIAAAQVQMPSVQRSDLPELLKAWGLQLRADAVITDFGNSLLVGMNSSRQPVRHAGILSLDPNDLSEGEVALAGLESLNLSSIGILDTVEDATTSITPLLVSSAESMPEDPQVWLSLQDPQALLKDFVPTGEQYVMAARVSGPAKTAFPNGTVYEKETEVTGSEGTEPETQIEEIQLMPELLESEGINVMVVADVDMLSDRLWVQVQSFFGQEIVTPFADNGSFLINSLEQLSGRPELIEIRSRGRFNRPFEKVEALRLSAEERFLAEQEVLEAELQATEDKLIALEQQRDESDAALFSDEQAAELLKFQDEKLKIRKKLRDVQHQLDKDIESLGTQLKLINIFLMPLIVVCLSLMFYFRKNRERTA